MSARECAPMWMCDLHLQDQKPIEAFCEACWVPLCMSCILTMRHKGHNMLTLTQAAAKCKHSF